MGNRGQDFLGDPRPELEDALLVAGGAEVPPFAGERQQVLVPARIAPDARESLGEVAAGEELLHNAPNDRPIEALLVLVPGGIRLLECGEVRLDALVRGPMPWGSVVCRPP